MLSRLQMSLIITQLGNFWANLCLIQSWEKMALLQFLSSGNEGSLKRRSGTSRIRKDSEKQASIMEEQGKKTKQKKSPIKFQALFYFLSPYYYTLVLYSLKLLRSRLLLLYNLAYFIFHPGLIVELKTKKWTFIMAYLLINHGKTFAPAALDKTKS